MNVLGHAKGESTNELFFQVRKRGYVARGSTRRGRKKEFMDFSGENVRMRVGGYACERTRIFLRVCKRECAGCGSMR